MMTWGGDGMVSDDIRQLLGHRILDIIIFSRLMACMIAQHLAQHGCPQHPSLGGKSELNNGCV